MKARTACPALEQLEAHAAGKLKPADADVVRKHVEQCGSCLVKAIREIKKRHRLKVGDVLDGSYELRAEIGKGGMGVVWEARHMPSGELVAIKVLSSSDPDQARRLEDREARIGLKLQHAGFVRIRELLTLGGDRQALVMDRLFGCTLAQHMRGRAALPVAEVREILRGIASALCVLHGLQVAHRDLSANNVYLESAASARVCILDLGLARSQDKNTVSAKTITRHGAVFGTEGFMAPEQQLALGNIGTAADIWSLGALAYFMLTGTRPGTSRSESRDTRLNSFAVSLSTLPQDTPEPLRRLMEHSLEVDIPKRPTAQAWAEQLESL